MKFHIRDLFWLTLLVALICVGYLDRYRLTRLIVAAEGKRVAQRKEHWKGITNLKAGLRKEHTQEIAALKEKHFQALRDLNREHAFEKDERIEELSQRVNSLSKALLGQYPQYEYKSPVQPLHMPPVKPRDGAF